MEGEGTNKCVCALLKIKKTHLYKLLGYTTSQWTYSLLKALFCARPEGAGRAKPEVSEQRSHEITSWMEILITGPFTAITLDALPSPSLLCPHTSCQPSFASNFESHGYVSLGLGSNLPEKANSGQK